MDIHCNILASDTKKRLPRSTTAIRVLAVFPEVETDVRAPKAIETDHGTLEMPQKNTSWSAGGEPNDRSVPESIGRRSSQLPAPFNRRILMATVLVSFFVAAIAFFFFPASNPDPASRLGSVTANAELYPTLAPQNPVSRNTTAQTTHTVGGSTTAIH